MPSSTNKIFLADSNGPIYENFDCGDYRIGYFFSKDPSDDRDNEDTLFINADEKCIFFGVADGAGGHPRGKDAAQIVGDNIMKLECGNKDFDSVSMVESINTEVIALKAGAKSTLALGVLTGDGLRCYSVGDSEIIYWNGSGNKIYSNIPDSIVGYQVEAGVIDQSESLDSPIRNIVTNMIGDEFVRIESTTEMIVKKGQTILVGTDGLFDNFTHENLSAELGLGRFDESFMSLVNQCIDQNPPTWKKADDIAFVVVRRVRS